MTAESLQPAAPGEVSDQDVASFCLWTIQHHGYDFTEYQTKPLRKTLASILTAQSLPSVAALIDAMARGDLAFPEVLSRLTVTTSTMFRDPAFFQALVREVFPYLKTYPKLKIWHAGCSHGEEVYSLAILLKEHGLLDRCSIYATDINPKALAAAQEGIYPARKLQEFGQNYFAAGGQGHLADHFHLRYGHAKFSQDLTQRVLFSKHDLVSDAVFGEMQLVLCRNVLIYFNPKLQERVLTLLRQSLAPLGFVGLGRSESLPPGSKQTGLTPLPEARGVFTEAPARP